MGENIMTKTKNLQPIVSAEDFIDPIDYDYEVPEYMPKKLSIGALKYSVTIDENGYNFKLYSDAAIKLFNKVVYNNESESAQVVECLVKKKELGENLIKQLDELKDDK